MELDIKKKLVNVFFILALLSFIAAGGYITSKKDFVSGSTRSNTATNTIFIPKTFQQECLQEAIDQYIEKGNKIENLEVVEDSSNAYYKITLESTLDRAELKDAHSTLDTIITQTCL